MITYYKTGKCSWKHGQAIPADWHVLLGPCPECGTPTFDYGGGWRCQATYCWNSANNMAPSVGPRPTWWNTGVQVYLDGDKWCAVNEGFTNPMESPQGWGNTPGEAVNDLVTQTKEAV